MRCSRTTAGSTPASAPSSPSAVNGEKAVITPPKSNSTASMGRTTVDGSGASALARPEPVALGLADAAAGGAVGPPLDEGAGHALLDDGPAAADHAGQVGGGVGSLEPAEHRLHAGAAAPEQQGVEV